MPASVFIKATGNVATGTMMCTLCSVYLMWILLLAVHWSVVLLTLEYAQVSRMTPRIHDSVRRKSCCACVCHDGGHVKGWFRRMSPRGEAHRVWIV